MGKKNKKQNKTFDKFLDLAKEQNELWVMVILVVAGTLGKVYKGLEKRLA